MIRLTTDHASSYYGIPVFVDADGSPLDYAAGIRMVRRDWKMNTAGFGEKLGVSGRTVEGWEQGRMPDIRALLRLMSLL